MAETAALLVLQKIAAILNTGEDERSTSKIAKPRLGTLQLRTLQRWKAREGLTAGDGSCGLRTLRLGSLERSRVNCAAGRGQRTVLRLVPPARFVPLVADRGVYMDSESSMMRVLRVLRVLREHGQDARRSRPRQGAQANACGTHTSHRPRSGLVLGHDLPVGHVMGRWFHLYLILDLYSRKILSVEVHDSDDADQPCTWCVARRWLGALLPWTPIRSCIRQRLHPEGHDGCRLGVKPPPATTAA